MIRRLASCDCNVLVTGETGSGKELAARIIHQDSGRGTHPFVAINCAAIPQTLLESELFGHERGAFTGAHATHHGKLESADTGTVLLDEIADMDMAAQANLLRAVETRQVERLRGNRARRFDVRFISATNQNLEELIDQRRFRADLFFRLSVMEINVPPLRDRTEDIPELVAHQLADLNRSHAQNVTGFGGDVLELFQRHRWPGKVRELRNTVEAAYFMSSSSVVGFGELPPHLRRRFAEGPERPGSEEHRVRTALKTVAWNKSEAARILHCSRMTLYRKLARYRIQV